MSVNDRTLRAIAFTLVSACILGANARAQAPASAPEANPAQPAAAQETPSASQPPASQPPAPEATKPSAPAELLQLHPNVIGARDNSSHLPLRRRQAKSDDRRFLPHQATPISRAGPDFGVATPLPRKLNVTPYGVVKGDLFWIFGGPNTTDSTGATYASSVNSFDVPQFGVPVPAGTAVDTFGASARKTRFGVHVLWPLPPSFFKALAIDAKIEIDFFGGVFGQGLFAYFSIPRLRFAYAAVSWGLVRLVFGQDNIIIAPQAPDSLFRIIPQAGGNTGNLFGRFPQVRVEGTTGGAIRFIWAGGLLANIQSDGLNTADTAFALFRRPQGGELSASPAVQGHVGVAGTLFSKPWSVGLGGHYARRRTQLYVAAGQPGAGNPNGTAGTNGWAGALDVQVPLHRTLILKGEAWIGQELEAYTGGIGQGLRVTRDGSGNITAVGGAVRSFGGWAELHFNPLPWLQFASVVLADNPIDSTLPTAPTTRSGILTLYDWAAIEVAKGYLIGVEYDYFRTNLRAGATLQSHAISLNGILYF